MIKKIYNFKFVIPARTTIQSGRRNYQKGMTYVELIVVLSIFAVMSLIVLFNYDKFQSKVDIKNLANDIALKVVEAQKSSVFGILPPSAQQQYLIDKSIINWKPSYGLYFNLVSPGDRKTFIYFTDLDQSGDTNSLFCPTPGADECLDKISLTKGNTISNLDVYYQGDTNPHPFNNIAIIFKRPNFGAIIFSNGFQILNVSYVQITVTSLSLVTAKIKVYASGRIQIN